jgi:nitroreductase
MDIYEAIEKRRTIRKFKGTATEEQLNKIINAATKAPSTRNIQNWEFVVVDDPALIEKIAEIKYIMNRGGPLGQEVPEEKEKPAQRQKESFANASLVVVFHNKKVADSAGPWCCIENMLLATVAEGLGARIARLLGEAADNTNKLLNAPEGMEVLAAISIGVPDEDPGLRKLRPEGSWLHRNGF